MFKRHWLIAIMALLAAPAHGAVISTDAASLAAMTVPGTVPGTIFLGTRVSGGSGLTGTSPPDAWAWTGDAGFDPTAANALDHRWIQGTMVPIIWDLGIPSNHVVVFPSIDHGPMSPAPYEAVEFTVWGSTNPAAAFPGGWTLADLTTIFEDGWIDVGAARESDDFASVWAFPTATFRYVAVYANGSIEIAPENPLNNQCAGQGVWCSGDHEIDAVGYTDIAVPVTPMTWGAVKSLYQD